MRPMVFFALALTFSVALSGCASGAEPEAESGNFAATGSVSVPSGADSRYAGESCDTSRGVDDRPIDGDYGDIETGAQVVVKDESGTTIAVATLNAGILTKLDVPGTLACVSSFTLTELPDAEFYSIHVGNATRGEVQFTKSEMQTGPAISLG